MIIKRHLRGGFGAAAAYLSDIGKNESVRVVYMSDPDAADIHEAFRNIWDVAKHTKTTKPLHHVSINPRKDERLTDEEVMRICARLEEKYGSAHGEHQLVIVEHVIGGRRHSMSAGTG